MVWAAAAAADGIMTSDVWGLHILINESSTNWWMNWGYSCRLLIYIYTYVRWIQVPGNNAGSQIIGIRRSSPAKFKSLNLWLLYIIAPGELSLFFCVCVYIYLCYAPMKKVVYYICEQQIDTTVIQVSQAICGSSSSSSLLARPHWPCSCLMLYIVYTHQQQQQQQ